jgi:hypothetical protein
LLEKHDPKRRGCDQEHRGPEPADNSSYQKESDQLGRRKCQQPDKDPLNQRHELHSCQALLAPWFGSSMLVSRTAGTAASLWIGGAARLHSHCGNLCLPRPVSG